MSKTAKFDRQQVIDKAKDLYWEKGFHATSMRNLQDVVDMRPGSIYAAFGSKEALFKEALAHYTEIGLASLQDCEQQAASPLSGLKLFMKNIVIESQCSAPNGMCMLAKTVAELTSEHQELLDAAKESLKRMEAAFAAVLTRAKAAGELAPDKDPQELARCIQVQIAGLRTYAKIHQSEAPLEHMIEDIFSHYPFH
jgi:AcrR family transcriptional regulator